MSLHRFVTRSALLAALLLTADSADAQPKTMAVDMYLKIEGVDGESTDKDHPDWIDIFSYGHRLTHAVLSGQPGGSGAPEHEPVVFVKSMDKSSPFLFDALNKGTALRLATIEFVDRASGAAFLFLRVELEDAYLISYAVRADAGGVRPTEEFALTYTRIRLTYWPQNPDGTPGPPITVGWDVAQNIPTSVAMGGVESWIEGRDVVFRWQTESQVGNYGFEVQKLEEDGFKRAAYVPGAGWSSEPLEYEVRIRGLSDGVHVFRIAGLGVGGRTSYSEEITIALGIPDDFTITLDVPYPNPFRERTNIAVTVQRPTEARISVWDLLGREVAVVHDGRIPAGFVARYAFEPPVPLASGVYVLRVESKLGTASRLVTVLP